MEEYKIDDSSKIVHQITLKQYIATQQTALRRWLAVSFFVNVILLVVVAFTIGGR